jgi:hypothetical protein
MAAARRFAEHVCVWQDARMTALLLQPEKKSFLPDSYAALTTVCRR